MNVYQYPEEMNHFHEGAHTKQREYVCLIQANSVQGHITKQCLALAWVSTMKSMA